MNQQHDELHVVTDEQQPKLTCWANIGCPLADKFDNRHLNRFLCVSDDSSLTHENLFKCRKTTSGVIFKHQRIPEHQWMCYFTLELESHLTSSKGMTKLASACQWTHCYQGPTSIDHPSRYGRFPCSLLWRHNGCGSVSNHQPHDCLLNRLFRRRSKKTSKLRVTGLCAGNSPVNSPHKWPVTRKMFPSDDVFM